MITGLLLAAGAGTRFGGAKLLAELDGRPLVLHAFETLRAEVHTVLAVVRPGDPALRELLEAAGAAVGTCADAALGMGHSLAWGARHAPADTHLIVALADMPRVQPDTVRAVAQALHAGAQIVVPTHGGRRGHPVGFAAALRADLETLRGDTGARVLLERYASAVEELPVTDPGVVLDVDTRAGMAALTDARA